MCAGMLAVKCPSSI